MLDTNAVSDLLKGQPQITMRIQSVPISSLTISAITEGELMFGLAKRPQATRLHLAVQELLARVEILPWTGDVAECYGNIRADLERRGKSLGALDCLIAAHAVAVGATLVSRDKAFRQVPGLNVENWTTS